jgi:hypothetical protein
MIHAGRVIIHAIHARIAVGPLCLHHEMEVRYTCPPLRRSLRNATTQAAIVWSPFGNSAIRFRERSGGWPDRDEIALDLARAETLELARLAELRGHICDLADDE